MGGTAVGALPSCGGPSSVLFSCGLPHMSLARWPRTISLCCSSCAARSAAGRVANVTKAQCRVAKICNSHKHTCQRCRGAII